MPPEPLPLDHHRKDFASSTAGAGANGYKDHRNKNDALASSSRWHHHHPLPPPPSRDFSRTSPRRPNSGYYRQGGGGGGYDRIYPEDYTVSRSDRYWPEDDGFSRGYSRYGGGRSGRDGRGSYRRSPYQSFSGDFSSRNYYQEQQQRQDGLAGTVLRSVAVPISPHDYDRSGCGGDGPDLERDREHTPRGMPWRSKWSQSGKEGSRSDGAEAQRAEGSAAVLEKEMTVKFEAPMSRLAEEETPRKKLRLGWGQGLAKYEKQKVEGPAEVSPSSSDKAAPAAAPSDAGLTLAEAVVCPSPPAAAPSNATCISSPGVEDKSCERTVTGNDEPNFVTIPGVGKKNSDEEVPINMDQLGDDPINSFDAILADILQYEDTCSGDSTLKRYSNMNKLMLLKRYVAKELEKTELEIDSLEVELKSMNREIEIKDYQGSVLLADSGALKPCSEPSGGTLKSSRDANNHEIVSSIEKESGNPLPPKDSAVKDVELKSPEMVPTNHEKAVSLDKFAVCSDDIEMAKFSETAGICEFKDSEANGLVTSDVQDDPQSISCDGNVDSSEADGHIVFSVGLCSHGEANPNLRPLIMSANKDAAKRASQLLVKASWTHQLLSDPWEPSNLSGHRKNDLKIREKLALRKDRTKFKEQVLTFKFRALLNWWKEDLRLSSLKKQSAKSSKRSESGSRAYQNSSHKQRSSTRSRIILPAGNTNLLPTRDLSDVASKLLSEFHVKRYRNNLKMPALIIDNNEKRNTKFTTCNGLIEDPVLVEKERTMINPWTREEKQVFLEMLATFGKDFPKISSFLSHKTTADCIEFYYKHHKSESFREVKGRLDLRKQQQSLPTSTYLATSGKKWNPETNAASLDMLGAASVVAQRSLVCGQRMEKNAAKSLIQTNHALDMHYGIHWSSDKDHGGKIPLHKRESDAADILAGICGAVSSEVMGSCVTSSVDPGEKMNCAEIDQLLMQVVNQGVYEEDTCSDEGYGESDSADWTDEEKYMFLQAVDKYGKNFDRISSCVKTRSREQCKIFFSKARKSLGLDLIHRGIGNGGMPMNDTIGGRSDTDEAFATEMDSAICSTQSCSKMVVDRSPALANGTIQGLVPSEEIPKQLDMSLPSEQDSVAGINCVVNSRQAENKGSSVDDDKLASEGEEMHRRFDCSKVLQMAQVAENVNSEMRDDGPLVALTEQTPMMSSESFCHKSIVEASQMNDAGGRFSSDELRKEASSQQVASETGSKIMNLAGGDTCTSSTRSICFLAETHASGNGFNDADLAGRSSRPTIASSYHSNVPSHPVPSVRTKPQVIPLNQKDFLPVQFNSVLPASTSICFDGMPPKNKFSLEDHGNKFSKSVPNEHHSALHNINGYPLQTWSQEFRKETDHLVPGVPYLSESYISKNGISQPKKLFVSNMQDDKSSGSNISASVSGMPCTRSGEKTESLLTPCSQRASPECEEQSQRPGDVKIFGKILNHQQSLQSSGTSSNDSKIKPPSLKVHRSASMKPSKSAKDGALYSSRPVTNGHLGLEDRPIKNYGFRDDSRLQTGISSLQESALVFAKYSQASFAGVPFYSAKNGSRNSNVMLTEYQQPLMQQLASDTKRLESFADVQKRNGIEVVSAFQQSGKAPRLGGAGILVSGVSDPVAALKMHYASLNKDTEPWRGDRGSR